MGKVRRLPSDLANQIAAGEVVERPASVVKELVENAIDAHATRVAITCEYGGKKLVRVEDDGEGMDADDAQASLDRHATSKIARSEDLAAILTHGFRGEALPSMASVSHLVLRTRRPGSPSGTEVRVSGGTTTAVREVGTREGTVVEVMDLFYNLPARRKFLKSDAAESAQVSRVVTQIALAYPAVGFTLTSAGRRAIECPPVRSLHERFYQLYGDREDLVDVDRQVSGIHVLGLVAALAEQGPKRGPQNVFVNRRVVKDKTIAHAVIEAYREASVKERSPEVHLFLDLPPDQVDVNVHPTKAEVRFRNQSAVHEAVRRALSAALGRGPAPALQLGGEAVSSAPPVTASFPGLLGGIYPNRWTPLPTGQSGGQPAHPIPGPSPEAGPVAPPALGIGERPLIPLGQFRDTFIIAIDDEGIAIIDQHVAHERVLFERIMQQLTDGRLESQLLLEPLVVDLPAGSSQVVLARASALERLGFDVADFGGHSVRVVAVPALLTPAESVSAVRAFAEDLDGLDANAPVDEALKRIAATTACHAAVKANEALTYEKMVHILDELRRTAYSTVCPHGRPVMLRLTRREIERNFQRI